MRFLSKDGVKETAWRWRCKVLRTTDERTLADYSDSSSSFFEQSSEKAVGKLGSAPGLPKNNDAKTASAPNAKDGHASVLGSSLIVKTLYEGTNVGDNFTNWQDYPPRQLSKSASKVQDRVAIKLYKIKDKNKPVLDGRFAMKYHQIDIQSPLIVQALAPILRDREDHHLDPDETATFHAPFRPLYFCYDAIVDKLRALQPQTEPADAALHPFLKLLVCVLDQLFAEVRTKRRTLLERGLLSFEHAWAYFPRHAIVRSHGLNGDVLSRVLDTSYVQVMGAKVFVLRVQVLRFNGEAFVWQKEELKVEHFAGNRPILEFDHYPLEHLPADEQAALKTRLAARGRLVLDCQGLEYRHYTGVGMHVNEQCTVAKHNVDGRILVDVVGYNKHHLAQGAREGKDPQSVRNVVEGTGRRPLRQYLAGEPESAEVDKFGYLLVKSAGGGAGNANAKDKAADPSSTPQTGKIQRLSQEEQAANKAAMLKTPDDLMFMSPTIEGYALKNKQWLSFFVEDIRPVAWNDQAYDHLVYDEQQKDLVLSFVESHGHTKHKVDDVIIGKGDGLTILLSGPPGTGKTLTAEAVADRTHRPLFYLQAEDLGISAATLGANIKKVFEMATEWDAVILLDEADVFMAERHPQDIARNELVSIFLRELEYFRGIIFLTTNLYDTIDTAFRSRVSLHLLFRPLTPEARLSVWRKFLARVERPVVKVLAGAESDDTAGQGKGEGDASRPGPSSLAVVKGSDASAPGAPEATAAVSISDEELQELAAWSLNGREIKTAVKMVTTWCAHKGHAMTLERLEHGIRVTSPHSTKTTQENSDLYD
ncbi:AAA family ATPase [Sporothrix schenckii 1099-18]|uniref:AAA family ATPase n=1 Tax=Sporothrix schenckii 1099-18 TaxID=1397361 RepID=A0A0F2M9E2_SPOSC|nr:AAA family ATPase [Sporothrix schenckii 1099-18]KJR86328.1 AAA family ATPase [Sporothrix schenckii 1099-18]